MNLLALATLVITGFVSGAEFGSYAFVHPVLRRLPVTERITVEQGLLKTFGRVMPIGMTLCVVLVTATAVDAGGTAPLAWPAAAAFTAAVLFTVVVNVPINRATGRWDAQHPPRRLGTDPQPLGVVPGRPLVAAAARVRAGVRGLRRLTPPERHHHHRRETRRAPTAEILRSPASGSASGTAADLSQARKVLAWNGRWLLNRDELTPVTRPLSRRGIRLRGSTRGAEALSGRRL